MPEQPRLPTATASCGTNVFYRRPYKPPHILWLQSRPPLHTASLFPARLLATLLAYSRYLSTAIPYSPARTPALICAIHWGFVRRTYWQTCRPSCVRTDRKSECPSGSADFQVRQWTILRSKRLGRLLFPVVGLTYRCRVDRIEWLGFCVRCRGLQVGANIHGKFQAHREGLSMVCESLRVVRWSCTMFNTTFLIQEL